MPFTSFAKNAMLNGLTFGFASLHSDFPGQTGLNEITGGSYGRQAIAVNAASGEQRSMASVLNFGVPGSTTVRWNGFWDPFGNFLGYSANDGTIFEFTIDLSTSSVDVPAHGLANGQKLVFVDGVVPMPLVPGTIYFAVGVSANALQVAATSGGAAIVFTSLGTGECQMSTIVEDVFASPGTHTLSSAGFALNL